jgi:hypothetical protein
MPMPTAAPKAPKPIISAPAMYNSACDISMIVSPC